MRTLKLLLSGLAGAFLVTAGTVLAYDPGSFAFDTGGGATELSQDLTPQLGGDLATQGYDITNDVALTGDSALNVGAFEALGTDASPSATTAARQIGGPSIYRGGIGTTALRTFVHANCQAGDAYTISGTDAAGVAITGGLGGALLDITAGGNWTLGADANGDATGFGAAITGNAYASTYITAVVATNNVGVRAVPGKLTSLTIALKTEGGGGACGTLVNGADGGLSPNYIISTSAGGRLTDTAANGAFWGCYLAAAGNMRCSASTATGGFSTDYCGGIGFSGYGGVASLGTSAPNLGAQITAEGTGCGSGTGFAFRTVGHDISVLPNAKATDVVPEIMTISTQEPIASAATAAPTNTTGGNAVIAPANGGRRITFTTELAAGGTVTVAVQTDGVSTNCTKTEGDGTGGTFECAGLTAAQCACALYATYTGVPCTGLTVTRLDGTCSNGILAYSRTAGAASYLGPVTIVGAGATAANGTDGALLAPSLAAATPSTAQFCFSQDTDTCIYTRAANQIGIGLGGIERFRIAATHTELQGPIYFMNSTALTAPLSGYMVIGSYAGGAGAYQNYPQTITCDADCDSPVTITSNVVIVNCTNAGGCALGLAETNWSATVAGTTTLVAGTTQTGALTLADAAGVTELAGGTSWTPTAGDTLQLVYNPSALTWAEVARADVTP